MYAMLKLRKWKDAFESNAPYIDIKAISYGFIEVYATLTDLHADYPNQKLVEGVDYLQLIEKDRKIE